MAETKPTYYEILGVAAGAARPDIDRAYLARKTAGTLPASQLWDLERAYVTLTDPGLRRAYDESLRGQPPPPVRVAPRRVPGPVVARWHQLRLPVLGLSLGVLALAVWLVLVPFVGWRFYTHAPGTELALRQDGRPFGVILRFETEHQFPGGIRADAYQVRDPATAEERWLTREEVNRLARARR